MYGKNRARLSRSIGSQSQYARGIRADFDAASALSLTALKPSPGGSMSLSANSRRDVYAPVVMPVLHRAERRDRIDQQEGRMPAASICRRMSAMRLTTPVDVSLWTTPTALI